MNAQPGKSSCKSGLHTALGNDEFEESEVWDILHENGGGTDRSPAFYYEDEARATTRTNRASAVRGIPRPQPSSDASRVQRSAPVNISYWGKDLNGTAASSSRKKNQRRDDSDEDEKEAEINDGEEEEGEKVVYRDCELPPHEFIARRLARSHIWSFSVFEGAGRKLKGRDLSQVRHSVLTKTGFLEPPSNLDK